MKWLFDIFQFSGKILRLDPLISVLWNVYGDCDNYATLKGHSGAVMELHYNTDGRLVFNFFFTVCRIFWNISQLLKTSSGLWFDQENSIGMQKTTITSYSYVVFYCFCDLLLLFLFFLKGSLNFFKKYFVTKILN